MSANPDSCPTVSVVMSVYNGGSELAPTIESVLSQSFTDFEFVIVDDGSTDGSAGVLEQFAKADARVIIVTQKNKGLTQALISGCQQSRGQFIARQDVGDRSLPDRFRRQVEFLQRNTTVAVVGAGGRQIGPKGEFLGDIVRDRSPKQITAELLDQGVGICHSVAMFRRDAFQNCGGYRPQFRFAQDIDLWHRISRFGLVAELPEALFEWSIDTGGISASNTTKQQRLAELARQSYQAIETSGDDAQILAEANEVSWVASQSPESGSRRKAQARANHFIGSQLYSLGDKRCRRYFLYAIANRPLLIRAWVKLILSYFKLRSARPLPAPTARNREINKAQT